MAGPDGAGERFGVLVSSAGRRVALVEIFRAALRSAGLSGPVVATDITAAAALHVADVPELVPPCADEAFVPAIMKLCRLHGVRLIVPTIDAELPVYAAHRAEFADAGVAVAVSEPAVVAVGTDKVAAYGWFTEHGFPVPRQADAGEVLAEPARWPFPLVAKPRFGNSARGVAVVHDAEELRLASRRGPYVVQTAAPGREHTVDLLVDRQGRCQAAVPRLRLEVRAGEVSKGVTVRHEGLERLGRAVAETLPGAYGALNLQVFADGSALEVIELNPRFGGGYPLAHHAGADLAGWLVAEAAGRAPAAVTWRGGVMMLRYDQAVFVDEPELWPS